MITNERQYRITKSEAERFEQALARAEDQGANLDPILRRAMRESLESQLDELREQLAEYEALRSGRIAVVELDSLRDLPEALIRARIAAGLTHKELAERLKLKEQQVQRYEATRYAGVTLDRIQEVAEALGLKVVERVTLPGSASRDANSPGPASTGSEPAGRGLAGALARRGMTLHNLAASLNIPNSFALKLQRGRVDPDSLPQGFLNRLAETLRVDTDRARSLVETRIPTAGGVHFRASGQPGPGEKRGVESFRDALAKCPDLTAEQRREWLDEGR